MEQLFQPYKMVTDQFLQKFDNHWKDMLHIVGGEQAQLIIGNRLRPQICLWGYLATIYPNNIQDCDLDYIANVAVSIELLHKASLLLDDWIDGDWKRHGMPAFHTEHTAYYTVLFSLNLIGFSLFRLKHVFPQSVVPPHNFFLCLDTLIQTMYFMAKGALEELRLQNDDFYHTTKIREITQLETAEIIGNSMLLGYYAGLKEDPNPKVEAIFKKIGDQCGYLFQALNDLEAFNNPQQLNAHKGTLNLDLFIHRKNLAISTLYEVARPDDREMLKQANETELLTLMQKYKIEKAMQNELGVIYSDILSTTSTLETASLSKQWCEGMKNFLGYVKQYAEKRLKR